MSDKAHETMSIEGIGEFRAKKGTATHQLAGAAAYWQAECLKAESRYEAALEKASARKWRDGFIAGIVLCAFVAAVTLPFVW